MTARRGPVEQGELAVTVAQPMDAAAIAGLINAAADHLTRTFGIGHWSGHTSERAVQLAIEPPVAGVRRNVTSIVLIARNKSMNDRIVATLHLATKKPWAIVASHFTPVRRALYLTSMAVDPGLQRRGVGRFLLHDAIMHAQSFKCRPAAQSIRLDAYDTTGTAADGAGAGGFYVRCGCREVARVSYKGTPLVYYELMLDSDDHSSPDGP